MKVVAFNGSPKKNGNTYQGIKLVLDELEKEGIETEIVHIGNKPVRGCISCFGCVKNQDEKCILKGDDTNEWIQKMKEADGILFGSPVHFSAMTAALKGFLDRAFFVTGANGSMLRHKVGAAVVAVRRSGGVPTFNQINNFINYAEMMQPSTNYWNVIHGMMPGEAEKDEEGNQIMRVLGKNMAYLMKLIENGKDSVKKPEYERKILTNFIR